MASGVLVEARPSLLQEGPDPFALIGSAHRRLHGAPLFGDAVGERLLARPDDAAEHARDGEGGLLGQLGRELLASGLAA
jgi:hypothetical protein